MTLKRSAHDTVADLCQFQFADGRLCRMLRSSGHPHYCLTHARHEQQLLDASRIGSELVSLSGGFKTASDVNHALGKLWTALSQDRIPARKASVLAFIGQLLLQSLPRVKHEISTAHHDFRAWDALLRKTFPPPRPLDPNAAPNSTDSDDPAKKH